MSPASALSLSLCLSCTRSTMKIENVKEVDEEEEAADEAEQRDFGAHLPAFNPLENQEKLRGR